MIQLFDYIPKEKKTFEEFGRFLFIRLDKDKAKFRKFTSFPDTYKIPLLIEFLEVMKGVPFLVAMNYYSYKHKGTPPFIELIKFTIIWEFKRLEENIETNYVPF